MSLAENLKRLARVVPGISGYQDREAARDTDKSVRLRLSMEIDGLKLELEEMKRRCMEMKDLSLLPALDTLASKLERTSNSIKYAERGYSGIFDIYKVDQTTLDKICSFDLSLFDEIDVLKAAAQGLRGSSPHTPAAREEIQKLDEAIEGFGKKFSARHDLITNP